LLQLPAPIAKKIVSEIKLLTDNPRPNGCKKLVGTEYSYRIRIGDYRVVYSVFDKQLLVRVVKLGHRKDNYN